MSMDNKAQISVEYLTMLAIALLLSAVIFLLVVNIISIKDGLVSSINNVRERMLQV